MEISDYKQPRVHLQRISIKCVEVVKLHSPSLDIDLVTREYLKFSSDLTHNFPNINPLQATQVQVHCAEQVQNHNGVHGSLDHV